MSKIDDVQPYAFNSPKKSDGKFINVIKFK